MVPINRRTFLTRLGGGTIAVAIFGVAACSDSGGDTSTAAGGTAPSTTGGAATTEPPGTTSPPATGGSTTTTSPPAPAAGRWERVDLGFVSAYVLARDGRAAVVDTGTGGSAGQIEGVLGIVGLGWDAVDHVILTHHHGDHVGSLGEVLAAAAAASAYAGAADIPSIASPRDIVAVDDGDTVFGLEIVATPGHTAGHVAVLDPVAGVLVAGDALRGGDPGTVLGPAPQFTADVDLANQSVRRLAELDFETLLVGHGEPIESGAGALVADLAATL